MTTDEFADEILGRCRERIERGETVDPEEVIRAHPEIASTLRDRFAALALLDATFARAATPHPDAPSLAGRRVGRYRLDTPLGEGGMGAVWLATADDGARVAVKVVHPHLTSRASAPGRFLREAELGQRVRHENVVRTLDAGEVVDGDTTLRYLVMEHVEGRTLRALLDESGKLPEELCRHVGREIAKGLAAIHAEGAVHRDLKPENVMVTRAHVVKVMDLGVARVAADADRLSQTGAFVGSLHYASPEQLTHSADVDGRADLHALGVLLYELATGAHPFGGGEVGAVVRRILDETPRRAGAVDPQVSPFFEELLAQLVEKDREKRPAGAAEVAAVLVEGEGSAWWRRRAQEIRTATRRPLRRIRIARETGLFGRDAEIARLRALFDKAKAGDGQVVLVEGEAGIGKSRLVDEFVAGLVAAGEDVDFLFGSWPPGGAATASGAFATAYHEHFGDEGLADALSGRLGAAKVLAPAFAALLSGLPPPSGAEPLTKDSLATCFVHVTRSLAAERTTVVLADDLHFAPAEGRALFSSLAQAATGHRVLLVGTARPEVDEKWIAQVASAGATRLPLARLGARDLVDLLRDAMRSDHLAEQLGAKIAAKSDGNPFFVFEILRGLREGRFITRRADGTWMTTRDIREIEVPPSIVGVVQARVSDLDRADRDVLEAASCVGFEFEAALVGEVLGVAPIPLMQRLGAIEKRHRLVRSVGRRFAFDHHQVQEVLYAGLSEPLREAYHAAIGSAIESRAGAASKEPKELDGALCTDIAEHLLKGGRGALSLRYLDPALTHLVHGHQHGAAVRLTDRALEVPGLLAGADRARLLLRKVASLEILARRDEERAAVDEALTLADAAQDVGLSVRAQMRLGSYLLFTSRPAEAEEALGTAVRLAVLAGDREAEAAATGTFGNAALVLCRYADAKERFERQLALCRETGNRWSQATATLRIGLVLRELGRPTESQDHLERALAIYREFGDLRQQAFVTGQLGNALHSLGRLDEALERFQWACKLARDIGDRQLEATSTSNIGAVLAGLGRLGAALEQFERRLELSRDFGDRRGTAILSLNLGLLLRTIGRWTQARERFEKGLSLAREVGIVDFEAFGLHALSLLCIDECDYAAAERHLTEALALRQQIGQRRREASMLATRGALFVRMGRETEARADLGAALELTREFPDPYVQLVAPAWLARLPGGDADAAIAAIAAHERHAGAEQLMEARFLLWQATGERAHLEEAKHHLDHLVAHAPPGDRETMVARVPLHRDIAEAARESAA